MQILMKPVLNLMAILCVCTVLLGALLKFAFLRTELTFSNQNLKRKSPFLLADTL